MGMVEKRAIHSIKALVLLAGAKFRGCKLSQDLNREGAAVLSAESIQLGKR